MPKAFLVKQKSRGLVRSDRPSDADVQDMSLGTFNVLSDGISDAAIANTASSRDELSSDDDDDGDAGRWRSSSEAAMTVNGVFGEERKSFGRRLMYAGAGDSGRTVRRHPTGSDDERRLAYDISKIGESILRHLYQDREQQRDVVQPEVPFAGIEMNTVYSRII
jgi:hypothetical protein